MAGYPPYSDEALQYYLWGLRKGFLEGDVDVPDVDIPEEQADVYNEGLLEGEGYGANGYPVDTTCYNLTKPEAPLLQEVLEAADYLLEAGGVLHTATAEKALLEVAVAATVEAGVLLFMAAVAAPTHYNQPTSVIDSSQAMSLVRLLQQLPTPLSLELFWGGGIDYDDSDGCQLQMTNIYKNADWARQALQDMGRPASILLSVRTDMSGGLRIVEQNGQLYQ